MITQNNSEARKLYCTVGYSKQIFEHIFDCEVDFKLESIKTGGKQCLMKIITINMDILPL